MRSVFSQLHALIMLAVVTVAIALYLPQLAASGLLNLVSLAGLHSIQSTQPEVNIGNQTAIPSLSTRDMNLLQVANRFDASNIAIRWRLAQAFFFVNDLDRAISFVNESSDYPCISADARPDCWLIHAILLAKEGNDEDAVRSWQWGGELATRHWMPEQYPLVLSSGVQVYRTLVVRHPERINLRFSLMELLWQTGQQQEAAIEADFLIQHASPSVSGVRAQALMIRAQIQEMNGDRLHAAETYQEALTEDPRLALAYVYLHSLYTNLGQVDQAATIDRQLASLVPQHSLPTRFQLTAWGGLLLGYDVGTESVGKVPFLNLVLYWRLPEGLAPKEPEWVRAGDHWLQFVSLPNLALNAGFEHDNWTGTGVPWGYNIPDWMPVAKSEQGLVLVRHNDQVSKVFRQAMVSDNRVGNALAAVELQSLRVQPGECFLFDADIRGVSNGGSSGVGNAWVWWQDEKGNFIADAAILGTAHDADPIVLCAPQDAIRMRFVLSASEGEVYWDNIVIIQLPGLGH